MSSLILFPIRTVHLTNSFFNYYWQQFVAVLSTNPCPNHSFPGYCVSRWWGGTRETECFDNISVSGKPSPTAGWVLWEPALLALDRAGQSPSHLCQSRALQHCAHMQTAFPKGRVKADSQIHLPCNAWEHSQDTRVLRCSDFHPHFWSRPHFPP